MPIATPPDRERSLAYGYDAVFCIFLLALAFLGRENPGWDSPRLPHWLVLLLSLNLGAGLALRRWASPPGLSAGAILANCGVIAAIVQESGGVDSRLWVLYLLPVFTASMFMAGRQVLLVAAGAVAFNGALFISLDARPDVTVTLDLGLRTGILALAAFFTWRGAERERGARGQIARQRGELQELLERAGRSEGRDESTRRLAEIGLVTAGVLHDLKTPLMVILGFAEVGRLSADPQTREDFDRIKRAGLVCRDIVSQVLAVSGGARPELEPCDLRQVVLSTLHLCVSVLEKRGVAVRVCLPEDPIRIAGSPQRLGRLFMNLLTNAAQAIGRGGTLEVRGRVEEPAGRVEIVVEDDGPGLSPQALASLFKPFSTTKVASGGSGLGLYICRQIALGHGGRLEASNRPQGGARFVLGLPLARVAAAA